MVIAPAKTGKDRSKRIAVRRTDHTNKGIWSHLTPGDRILRIVVIKLIAPKIEEAPARWSEKIERSTEAPEWEMLAERGGYTVHPVPTPFSTSPPIIKRVKEGGSNQNLRLFIRGNAMSGAPIIKGTSQFPKPPIIMGITIKKIITKAWAVTITLYVWSLPINGPGCPNSIRISILSAVPIKADQTPKIKYNVPISLWFVENIHRISKMADKSIKL